MNLTKVVSFFRFVTRDAFMRNVMNQQNFTHYPHVLELIRASEQLFRNIQAMETVVPLQAEERLFIDAIRGLNYQASKLQAEEQQMNHREQEDNKQDDKGEISSTNSGCNTSVLESLDEATTIVVDAAGRLNNSNAPPNLDVVLGWMKPSTEENILKEGIHDKDNGGMTDGEVGEDTAEQADDSAPKRRRLLADA